MRVPFRESDLLWWGRGWWLRFTVSFGGGGGRGGLETCEVSMIGAAGFKVSGSTGFIVRATTKTTANEV